MDDLNYTLLQTLQEFGGIVVREVDTTTGEVAQTATPEDGSASDARRAAAAGLPLSKAHISPFIEWTSGAGLLKVSRGIEQEQQGGGKRGKVKGFSFASRRRMMYTLAKVRRDAELPCFITLTYPNKFPSPMESKKHLDRFVKRFRRAFPSMGGIWKLEPQQRGAPHYHLLAWGCEQKILSDFVPAAWHDIAGGGDSLHLRFHLGELGNKHCVSKVETIEHMMAYAAKYLGKTFEVAGWDDIYPGRFWAIIQKQNIPFGEVCKFDITASKASHIIRYQKRFSGIRSRNYPSLTTFCNADQWIKNITREVVKK